MMRSKRYKRRRTLSTPEVSLTPLIDTALTLLIIFMVTAPMINNAIKVELPKGAIKEGGKEQQELVVTIDQKGEIYFNNKQVSLVALEQTIKDYFVASAASTEKSVWVRVHGATTTCDTLVDVMSKIKNIGGVKDVKIATQKMAVTSA
ncbi:MAG: biopolymer transporter ExbD [Candidatus Babeliales bacterium]